jgi:hypothetical protein
MKEIEGGANAMSARMKKVSLLQAVWISVVQPIEAWYSPTSASERKKKFGALEEWILSRSWVTDPDSNFIL